MIITGKVRSGEGRSAEWMEKLKDFYHERTGTLLFPGTLNVEVDTEWSAPDSGLPLAPGLYGGDVPLTLIPCLFIGREAFIVRTAKAEAGEGVHPKTIVEVASDLNLRKVHRLKDGDEVKIEVLGK